jgi:diaminopimelate decarboxylase
MADILAQPRLSVRGLHIYAGAQCLDADSVVENFEVMIELFERVCERHDLRPEALVFGAGFGIPYHEDDSPLDLPSVAGRVVPGLGRLRRTARFEKTAFVLETGRYLIGEAGYYLTRVVSAKRSRGKEIRICDGGMNHHLAACGHFGSVIPRNFRMFTLEPSPGASQRGAARKSYDVYGPLCTSIDRVGLDVHFDGLEVGDVIAIRGSGAYAATASQIHFTSHPPPREFLVDGDTIEDATPWRGRITSHTQLR